MERRTLLGLVTGGLFAAPLAAEAQTPGRMIKLGILSTVNPRTTTFTEAMVKRLGELGHVEGQNLAIEFRNAQGDVTRLPALAALSHPRGDLPGELGAWRHSWCVCPPGRHRGHDGRLAGPACGAVGVLREPSRTPGWHVVESAGSDGLRGRDCDGHLEFAGALQVFALDHPNVQIGTYPTVMVPAFGVPSSIILHGLSLWQLRRRARQTALHTQSDWNPDLRSSTI